MIKSVMVRNMQPIIKWPGGKAEEIKEILDIIPKYNRYVEPFVGGGAVYFYLPNTKAIINDISVNLINLYTCIKDNNQMFKNILVELDNAWDILQLKVRNKMSSLVEIYKLYSDSVNTNASFDLERSLIDIEQIILHDVCAEEIIKNKDSYINETRRMVLDKFKRTYKNELKFGKQLSLEDLQDNIMTGFTSGFYMYVRREHNNVEKMVNPNLEYRTALFYFVREYCYGSMFRYNSKGEFNIPYGGIGYNNKDFKKKINNLFSKEIIEKFSKTEIMCGDFSEVFNKLTSDDFMFVDPPYDTEFSDYEGRAFEKNDQVRLRDALAKTKAKFILIIKNTDFIYNLYNNDNFKIKSFDKNYAYCVKNRNDRSVDHLIITNY